ncbi:MAG: hypothetical protein ABIR82_06210 [Nocardioides sp.]
MRAPKVIGTYVDPALAKVTAVGATLAGRTGIPQAHHPIALRGNPAQALHPKWDRVKLANVSHSDVQAWVSDLARGHSPAAVHNIHQVLSLVLDMAVKDGRLARNGATE